MSKIEPEQVPPLLALLACRDLSEWVTRAAQGVPPTSQTLLKFCGRPGAPSPTRTCPLDSITAAPLLLETFST